MTTENTLGQTGIPVKEVWGVWDSSKIQAFMDCPRGFFYSYILGWRSKEPNEHLVFGSAWHEAVEHLLLYGNSPNSIQEAVNIFVKVHGASFDPFLGRDLGAKDMQNGIQAIVQYASMFNDDPADTLYTEVAGTAPIADDRLIHFKVDSIRRHPRHHEAAGKIHSLEHKTTGRLTTAWKEKWSYYFQVGTYTHVLYCLYEPDEVDGIIINGAVLRAKNNEFLRIPVRKSQAMMQMWLFEANHWIDQIVWNMERLAESKESDTVMPAFPRNSASCSKFGCRHPELCCLHANPLRNLDRIPLGYGVEHWDPRDREKSAQHTVDLTQSKEIKTNEPAPDVAKFIDLD